jgi:hypothetical protein
MHLMTRILRIAPLPLKLRSQRAGFEWGNLGKLRKRRGRASDARAFYYRRIDSVAELRTRYRVRRQAPHTD